MVAGEDRHRADVTGAGQTMRLQTDMLLGIEAKHVRARHVLHEGEELYCALSWDETRRVPATADEANEQLKATDPFLAPLAGAGPDPRPRASPADPALGARDQGPHLHADRARRSLP